MRKLISLIVIITSTLLLIPCTNVSAATTTSSTEITPLTDNYYIETTIITHENVHSIMARSTSSTKSAYTVCEFKSPSGNTVATYTLNATFSYNGTSSSCTSVSCSSSISDSKWKFTTASCSKSGKTATGNYSLTSSWVGQTITRSVSLSCSANGTIS